MAYSEEATKMRRCTGVNKDGAPCGAWSMWGGNKCRRHTIGGLAEAKHPAKPTCNCAAYAWPHRPGGGLCQWPAAPNEVCETHKPRRLPKREKTVVVYDSRNEEREWPREQRALLKELRARMRAIGRRKH